MDRPIEKKKWPLPKVLWLSVAAFGTLFVTYWLFANSGQSRLRVDPDRISIAQVTVGDFLEYVPITGSVQPNVTVFLDLEEGGIVEEIFVDGGSPIQEGDLILRFSNTAVQKQNIDSESRLLENLDRLSNTKISATKNILMLKETLLDLDYRILELQKTYERYQTLVGKPGAITKEKFESTQDELDYLKQKRDLLKERIRQETLLQEQQNEQVDQSMERVSRNLDILEKISESLDVRAPISGHLSTLNAEVGQSFNRGQRIGQIDQLDGFKVRASVDQYYIGRVAVGLQGSFEFNGQDYMLEVNKIYPEVVNDSFQIDLAFVNGAPNGVKRGQTLQIDLFLSDSKNTKVIAKGGYYRYTNGRWVYKVADDRLSAYKVDILVGQQNPRSVEVLEGLEVGDWIITSSYDAFNDADLLKFPEPLRN